MQIGKPKTCWQHLFYWPFLALGVFFIYLDLELIYNYLFRQRSDDTLVYTGAMLIIISLFSYGFFAIASAVVRPKKDIQTIRKEEERAREKEQGVFYGIQFVLKNRSLKLGEQFSIRIEGLKIHPLKEDSLVLIFYCKESIGYAAGGDSGYTITNIPFSQKHQLTQADRSGGEIQLTIPTDMPHTYLGGSNLKVEWYLRVEFSKPKDDLQYFNAGITSSELNVTPELVEGASFKTPKTTLQKQVMEEKWLELDTQPTEIDSPLIVVVGDKVSGKLVVLNKTRPTKAKKLSVELCFCLHNDEQRWLIEKKHHVKIPDLEIGERFEFSFEFLIPEKGPISAAGEIFIVNWSIRSRTFSEWLFGLDSVLSSPFNVVPKGYIEKAEGRE